MNEETQYNLAINLAKQKKAELEKEISELFKKKDFEFQQYSEKQWKNILLLWEIQKLEEKKYLLWKEIETIEEKSKLDKNNHTENLENYNKILEWIRNDIMKKEQINKNMDDQSSKLSEINEAIAKKEEELSDLRIDIVTIAKEKQEIWKVYNEKEKELTEKEKELIEKEKYLLNTQISLEKKEKNLNILESRLKNLKNSLLKKWEQPQ